jgi:hypothetical protein
VAANGISNGVMVSMAEAAAQLAIETSIPSMTMSAINGVSVMAKA